MKFYGFDCKSMGWMKKFLEGRSQRTIVDGNVSHHVNLVIQGAPLGPLLFIIYINDIANIIDSNTVFYKTYAYDTVIIGSCDTDLEAVSANRDTLCHIKQWCNVNSIVVHPKRTKHMYVGSDRKVKGELAELHADDEVIERVRQFKYLGVVLDEKLNFVKYIETMTNVVTGKLISLTRIRKYMNMGTSLLLYKQMILPLLDYMCIVVNSSTCRVIKKLHPLQNRAVKVILGINRYVSTEEMNGFHVQWSLMKLCDRRKLFMLKMMYKYSQREEYVEQYKPQMELLTRPKVKMKLHNTKKERVLCSPYHLANKLWDQLDHVVQNLDTMFEFVTALKMIDLVGLKV